MLVNLTSDEEDSEMVVIKNEPENEDMDIDGYGDRYRDNAAVYEDKEYSWSQ